MNFSEWLENEETKASIKKIIDNKNRIIPFIGSGISSENNLPMWAALLDQMSEHLPDDAVEDYTFAIAGNDYLYAGQIILDNLKPTEFCRIISSTFENFDHTNRIADAVIRFQPKFAITTNYDRILEHAFTKTNSKLAKTYTHKSPHLNQAQIDDGEFYINHIHGSVDSPLDIVLGKKSYIELMHANPHVAVYLDSIYSRYSFLFIGYSLSDPDLDLHLTRLSTATNGMMPTNYMFISPDISKPQLKKYRNEYSMAFIVLPDLPNKYDAIPLFLDAISSHLGTTAQVPAISCGNGVQQITKNNSFKTIARINNDFIDNNKIASGHQFYKFTKPKWSDITSNLDFERSETAELLNYIANDGGFDIAFVIAPSGEGKSTLLKRLAYLLLLKDETSKILFLDANNVDLAEVKELVNLLNDGSRHYIFIDDALRNNVLFEFLSTTINTNINVCFVCASQVREYRAYESLLISEYHEPKVLELKKLTVLEQSSIIQHLKNASVNITYLELTGTPEYLTEFMAKIIPENNFEHYVSNLVQITFDNIEQSNHGFINEPSQIYLDLIKYVSLFHSYGVYLSYADFLAILNSKREMPQHVQIDQLLLFIRKNLHGEIVMDEGVLSFRHEILATNTRKHFFDGGELEVVVYLSNILPETPADYSIVNTLAVNMFKYSDEKILMANGYHKFHDDLKNAFTLEDYKEIFSLRDAISQREVNILKEKIKQIRNSTSSYFNRILLKNLIRKHPSITEAYREFCDKQNKFIISGTDVGRAFKAPDRASLTMIYEKSIRDLATNPKSNAIVKFISCSYYLGKYRRAYFILDRVNGSGKEIYTWHKLAYLLDSERYDECSAHISTMLDSELTYARTRYLVARFNLITNNELTGEKAVDYRKYLEWERKYLNRQPIILKGKRTIALPQILWFLASVLVSENKKTMRSFGYFWNLNIFRLEQFKDLVESESHTHPLLNQPYFNFTIPMLYVVKGASDRPGSIYKAFYLLDILDKYTKFQFCPTVSLRKEQQRSKRQFISMVGNLDGKDSIRVISFTILLKNFSRFFSCKERVLISDLLRRNSVDFDEETSIFFNSLIFQINGQNDEAKQCLEVLMEKHANFVYARSLALHFLHAYERKNEAISLCVDAYKLARTDDEKISILWDHIKMIKQDEDKSDDVRILAKRILTVNEFEPRAKAILKPLGDLSSVDTENSVA